MKAKYLKFGLLLTFAFALGTISLNPCIARTANNAEATIMVASAFAMPAPSMAQAEARLVAADATLQIILPNRGFGV